MSFLISLLMFLGVITSPSQVNENNAAQYEADYATQENIDLYHRQHDGADDEGF